MKKEISDKAQMTEFLLYTTPTGAVKVETLLHDESLWLTQKRIAELFGVQRPAVTKHLSNIFQEGELQEPSVSSILEHTADDGKKYKTQVIHSDFDKLSKALKDKK